GVTVTFLEEARLDKPIAIGGATVLEPGAPIVWFTFPGVWHDIGRFHRRDGTFTGFYANVLTPVEMHDAGKWSTTDLFLDVWLRPDGSVEVLDEYELEEALGEGWIDAATAVEARREAERVAELAR